MDSSRLLKVFFSLLLFQVNCGKLDFINIDPFVDHYDGCYVSLIFYQVLDFESPSTPIVLMSHRYDAFANKTTCIAKGRIINFGPKHTLNVNPDICPYVLANYIIKGINCVAVVGVLPPPIDETGKWREESDIYWYLNHYWSRADTQESMFRNNETRKHSHQGLSFPPFFPTEIYIQVIMSSDSFQVRKETKKGRTEIIRTWAPYSKLPIITIVADEGDFAMETIPCRIALSVGELSYFASYVDSIELNLSYYYEKVDEWKNSNVHIVIVSHLTEPLKPHNKILYVGLEAVQFIMADQFLPRAFNSTRLESVDPRHNESHLAPNTWVLHLDLRPFLQMHIGSNVLFLPVTDVKSAGVTCGGLSTRISFSDYLMPFSFATWAAILGMSSFISAFFFLIPKYTHLKDVVPLLLISILLEESFSISGGQFKLRAFRTIVGSFILLSVVLSNGYKGVVITSLVRPFDEKGIESLEEAIQLGFTSIGIHSGGPISNSCCQASSDLNQKIKPLLEGYPEEPLVDAGVIETCGDFLVFEEQLEYIFNMPLEMEKVFNLVEKIANSVPPRLTAFNENQIENKKGRALMKLVKATTALECGKDPESKLAECEGVLYIESLDALKKLIYFDKFNPNRKNEPKYYILEDKTRLLRTDKWGITLSPMNIGRERFLRDLHAFVESGINAKIQELEEFVTYVNMTSKAREEFGRLEDQNLIPHALNLETKIRVMFYIYLISILNTLLCLALEIPMGLKRLSQNRVKKCNTNYPYIK